METVSVKLVVFKHPEPARWDTYCSYCPELQYFFGRGETVNVVINDVRNHLLVELSHRLRYVNLKNCGWEVSENSAKPPIFADDEAIRLTEKSYGIKISNYQIIKIDVELPPIRDMF